MRRGAQGTQRQVDVSAQRAAVGTVEVSKSGARGERVGEGAASRAKRCRFRCPGERGSARNRGAGHDR